MKNKSLILILTVILAGIFLFIYSNNLSQKEKDNKSSSSTPSVTLSKGFSVVLSEQNGSGENGIAVIEGVDDQTLVKLKLTNYPNLIEQPAHIHLGSCEEPTDIKYSLVNAVNGESETTLDASIDQLMKKLPLVLNVHKSNEEVNVYYACGVIKI